MALKFAPLIFMVMLLSACGVKSYPTPMDQQDPSPITLYARTVPQGVELSFSIPAIQIPDKAINQVIIKYTYTAVAADPTCPGCPPVFKYSRTFDLQGMRGNFTWLDTEAPYGLRAIYQAVVIDGAGRESKPSPLTNGFMLRLPPTPQNLVVRTMPNYRELNWQEVAPMDDLLFNRDTIGYMVERSLAGQVEQLSDRPLSAPQLHDYTANPSRTYRYRITSARVLDNSVLVMGEPGPWVKAAPYGRQSSLLPPENLVAVSVPQGIYLRFEPVADPENRGYLVERRHGANDASPWLRLTPAPQTENTYIDTDVISGQYYQYRVMAVDEEGDNSDPCEAVTVIYLAQEEE